VDAGERMEVEADGGGEERFRLPVEPSSTLFELRPEPDSSLSA
jgi:hypothetical protein